MAVITISRGSYSKGKEVAALVARKLGYRCIAREVVLDACKEFNIPEVQLVHAIHDAPSILERFTHGKEKYVGFFRAAFLKQLVSDNVVYHGLAGHFFLEGVAHALKVRIISDMEDRVKTEMERENVSREEALRVLKTDDEERRKWSQNLYGIDTADPGLYDIVIHIRDITVESAAEIICAVAMSARFRTTPESQKTLRDKALAAEVGAAIVGIKPDAQIQADEGLVTVEMKVSIDEKKDGLDKQVEKLVKAVPGVTDVRMKALETVKGRPYFS
ncbi:MAG: AAA family ATPase [Syntrophobacteraceae bacterium]